MCLFELLYQKQVRETASHMRFCDVLKTKAHLRLLTVHSPSIHLVQNLHLFLKTFVSLFVPGIWDLGFGIWVLEFGMWNLRFGI